MHVSEIGLSNVEFLLASNRWVSERAEGHKPNFLHNVTEIQLKYKVKFKREDKNLNLAQIK